METSFIESTTFIRSTGRHTDTITALQRLRTICGGVAGAGDTNTFNLGVTSEVLRTDTLLPVSGDTAEGIEAAGGLEAAGIQTLAILTNLIGSTVPVSGARS